MAGEKNTEWNLLNFWSQVASLGSMCVSDPLIQFGFSKMLYKLKKTTVTFRTKQTNIRT